MQPCAQRSSKADSHTHSLLPAMHSLPIGAQSALVQRTAEQLLATPF